MSKENIIILKSITIISLMIILDSFTMQAQNFPEQSRPTLHSFSKTTKNPNILKSIIPNSPQVLKEVITSDGSTSGNGRAPNGRINYIRCVYLVTPTEMANSGIPNSINLTQIGWTYSTAGDVACTGSLKVFFQNTSDVTNNKSTNWTSAISPMTEVDNSGSFTVPASTYILHILSNPSAFSYSGGGLYIAFEWSFPSGTLATTTVVACNTSLTNGLISAQSYLTLPNTLIASNYRPETYLGYDYTNDIEVVQAYSLGKLPIPYATPNLITSLIRNNGDDARVPVTLTITGANSFTDTKIIDNLSSGSSTLVNFSSFIPVNTGIDTIVVSIPNDINIANNSKKVIQIVTFSSYSYAYGPFPATAEGHVGFTGTTGDFAAKFFTSSAATINQVSVNFMTTGVPFEIGIWDAGGAGGIPGTKLWTSAPQTTSSNIYTLIVPKIAVSGNFYIGILQTDTLNVGFAYQNETPIRSGTFYFTSPTGNTSWNDFAPNNSFRIMIEPKLTIANDVGVATIDYPAGGIYNNISGSLVAPKATIYNFGSNDQSSIFNATMKIFDSTGTLVYTSVKTLTLNAGGVQRVIFDSTFNPTATIYMAKCYTTLGSDGDLTNDSVSIVFHYLPFSLHITALVEALFAKGVTEMSIAPTVTIELHDAITKAIAGLKTIILSTSGVGSASGFNSVLNSFSKYYLVVKSQNTIETWSSLPLNFSEGTLTYDFSDSLLRAYTDGSNPPMAIHSGRYCLYSGDLDQNGLVTSADYTGVDNDNSHFTYHLTNDLDGNGIVTSADFTFIDNNNSQFIARQVP